MTPELQAAAERIRFTYRPDRGGYVCSHPGNQDGLYTKALADDGESISWEWLKACGAKLDGAHLRISGFQFYVRPMRDEPQLFLHGTETRMMNRGEFRAVYRALTGIPLTEKGAG